jgi:hypothetical protein
MKLHPSLCTAMLAAAATAQGFTSPAGYTTTEGSSNHDYILFRYTDLTFQQLDETSVGTPAVVNRISFRRDGTGAANAAWAARTLDIEAVLSDSIKPVAISETYSANYVGTPTVVFARRPVNLPDWTQLPVSVPAPWNLNLQLDTPWVYTGLNPFLWELRVTNNTQLTNYGNDFQSTPGSTSTSNAGTIPAGSTGCIATGQTTAMSLTVGVKNQVVRFRIAFNAIRTVPLSPALVFLDSVNSNLAVPGLCATLVAMPNIVLPLGASDATGVVPELAIDNIPYAASMVGGSFFSQAASIDLAQPVFPVALSNGRQSTFPTPPVTHSTVTRVYGYRLSATSMRAPSVWTGGMVTLLD